MPNINHKLISDHLLSIGFWQPIRSKNGCYVNDKSIIIYYSANNGDSPIYTVCYKEHRYEFTEVVRINTILGFIDQKINSVKNEIIHRNVAENARY